MFFWNTTASAASVSASAALGLLCLLSSTTTTLAENCPVLTWSDEFDGSSLDSSKWTPQLGDGCDLGTNLCGWGNNEAEWYLAENAQVSSGTLKLTAKRESVQNKEFTSARIKSLNTFEIDLTHDTLVEARIKVPSGGQGLWPAFWMVPAPEVTWPLGGEIDIMEFIGREPFHSHGYIHYGAGFGDKIDKGGPIRLPEPLYEDFHVVSIIKTFNKITWQIDGHEYQSFTPEDVEPKYTWPFEQTYYLLLNLAVGGNWPGNPDDSTIFPSTMEVDYVRVYDLDGGTEMIPLIQGSRLVLQNQANVEYCVSNNANGNTITWDVPLGSSFFASTNPGCIVVNFGASSGYVKANFATTCTQEGRSSLAVPVEVQPNYGVEFSILDPTTTPSFSTGLISPVTMDGSLALKYTRSLDRYDRIEIDVDIPTSDLPSYLSGDRKLFLDIKTTTSAPCTQIVIQFEDQTLALPDNFPSGRHSKYQCLLEPTRDWQRVACDFTGQPDTSVAVVNKVVVLLDPSLTREDVYYFGYMDVTLSGCTDICEKLRSNGASTANCRKAAKSEAGACSDGINNNYQGYDGNLVTDCSDPACFMIDPMCGGPPIEQPASIPPPLASLGPIAETLIDEPVLPIPPSAQPASSPPPSASLGLIAETLIDGADPPIPPSAQPASSPPRSPSLEPITVTFVDGPVRPIQCSLNPACAGLTGDCCPTAGDTNIFLDCCFEEASTPRALPTPPSYTPLSLPFDGSAACSLNPTCVGLTGDCCPTMAGVDGVYLDCCFGYLFSETKPSPMSNSTFPLPLFDGPAECTLNPACVGLADDCCPTKGDGIFLACCFEALPSSVSYEREFTFIGPQLDDEQARYLVSSSPYFVPGTAPDGSSPVVTYNRGVVELYDLIYYETNAIPNAADYVSGNKTFFMDVYSAADECSQILIQLEDALTMAHKTEYPTGRHSRYVAFTTKSNEWERLEFNFLDQPDDTVSDSIVSAIVLFFDPGSLRGNQYFFRNFNSGLIGCDPTTSNTCEGPGIKSCPISYKGEGGSCDDEIDNDEDGLVDCEDLECVSDPVCAVTVSRSYSSAKSLLLVNDDGNIESSTKNEAAVYLPTILLGLFALAAVI